MFDTITKFMHKPPLFAPGTDIFWNDAHISKHLLEAHLNPDLDAASRNPSFINQSASWIVQKAPPKQYRNLLDLGCGPGLYAQRFANAGYNVTGIDFSKRSIAYANKQARANDSNIQYHFQNYLTIDFDSAFDIITLIYCDFGALSTNDRCILSKKIYRALKPQGKLVLDVFTPEVYTSRQESSSWNYYKAGGFWSNEPHICLNRTYHYDEDTTELRQTIVQTKDSINCYNIWEHFFTKDALLSEMGTAGFTAFELYEDVSGKEFSDAGDTICGIFTK